MRRLTPQWRNYKMALIGDNEAREAVRAYVEQLETRVDQQNLTIIARQLQRSVAWMAAILFAVAGLLIGDAHGVAKVRHDEAAAQCDHDHGYLIDDVCVPRLK